MKSSVIFVTILVSRIACLSLDEIHSSSKTFKSIAHNNEDKSLRTAIDTIRRRRQEYPIAQLLGPFSLPLKYYERLVPLNKNRDQQVVDDLLGQNQIGFDSDYYLDNTNDKDLISSELALKLSELLKSEDRQDSDIGHRIYNRINRKRKRSTSKQNNYFNQLNAINNDRKHLKNVKNTKDMNQHKNNSIKTLTKRKSSRRVLNDHFNIEENHQNVINKDMKSTKSTVKPMKSKVKTNKKEENKIRAKGLKRKIRKRKVEISVTTDTNLDRNSGNNESKTPPKEMKTTEKSVVSELNDILSDDNKTDENIKKTIDTKVEKSPQNLKKSLKKTNKSIRKMTKRNDQNIDSLKDNFDDNNAVSDDIIVYPNIEKIEEKDENELHDNKEFDDWIRREFYENMAKTLATMRKKRSEDFLKDQNDAMDAIEESETMGDNIIAIDDTNDRNLDTDEDNDNTNKELKNFDNLSDDPEDNDYVIAAIDDDIKGKIYSNDDREDNEDDINDSDIDWNNVEEKSESIKTKRSVPSYFGELEDIGESNDINSKHFNRVYENLESIEDSLLNEALDLIRESAAEGSESEINSNKIANRLDAAYDIEDMRTTLDDLKTTFDKISNENDNEVNNNYQIFSTLSTPAVYTTHDIDRQKKNSIFEDSMSDSNSDTKCYEMLSSDCSAVADLLPTEDLRYSLASSCNWHHICYTCGEIYGLLSSDCDAGFLEASRLSCAGSPSCEAFARLVLVPLRKSRVFYKSSVPQTCYRNQCIRDFLFDSQNKR